jgi:hypothetical protein
MKPFFLTLPAALTLLLAAAGPAHAQQSHDFMAGRLFQVALENAPNFSAQGSPTFGTLAASATQHYDQSLVAGTCYTWIAVGESGQGDIDLSVSVNGAQVAGDNAPDDWPIAVYCSPQQVSAGIDLRMYSGAGDFAFNTFSRAYGITDPIELNMAFLGELLASGQTPQGPITRGTLATGASTTYPVAVNGGQCYTIIGTGGPGVQDLDLFLLDASGHLVSQDVATDNAPVVGFCPQSAGNFTLRVVMYAGAGDFGWQPFAGTP